MAAGASSPTSSKLLPEPFEEKEMTIKTITPFLWFNTEAGDAASAGGESKIKMRRGSAASNCAINSRVRSLASNSVS